MSWWLGLARSVLRQSCCTAFNRVSMGLTLHLVWMNHALQKESSSLRSIGRRVAVGSWQVRVDAIAECSFVKFDCPSRFLQIIGASIPEKMLFHSKVLTPRPCSKL